MRLRLTRLCRWPWARSGRLDVVVNNAGYGDVAPFEQLSSERFKAVIDTNFYGVTINNVLVSGGVTFVEMVQAADLRNRNDFKRLQRNLHSRQQRSETARPLAHVTRTKAFLADRISHRPSHVPTCRKAPSRWLLLASTGIPSPRTGFIGS
jgi:short chain dehydrogenase